MTLEVRSAERAIEAARFFAPLLGPSVGLERLRVVNRWFDAGEAAVGLDRLDKLLDANVVRTDANDPHRAERAPPPGPKRKRRLQRSGGRRSAKTSRSSKRSPLSRPTRRRPTSAT